MLAFIFGCNQASNLNLNGVYSHISATIEVIQKAINLVEAKKATAKVSEVIVARAEEQYRAQPLKVI